MNDQRRTPADKRCNRARHRGFCPVFTLLILLICPWTAVGAAADDNVSTLAAIVSFNPILGDLRGNIARIERLVDQAIRQGAKIVVLPEQATTGFGITKEQALHGLAITHPFPELANIIELAKQSGAFVTFGIAERAAGTDALYNSAVVIQPSGAVTVQRKRLASSAGFGWNSRGDTPFDVYPTPFGDIAVLICADTFLMDWTRIATLKGADIILLPANWWGNNHQIELWRARAAQDGVWILAANRWGAETNLFPPPNSYYMSDGPTAAVAPSGLPIQVYEADQAQQPADQILYQVVTVPNARVGKENPTFSVLNRRPSAYPALANSYYAPPRNLPVPNLPPSGVQPVQLIAYQPDQDAKKNLNTVASSLKALPTQADALIVLPGLGLMTTPIDRIASPTWYADPYWLSVIELVKQQGAQGLVTSVVARTRESNSASLAVVFVSQQSVTLYPQIHNSGGLIGSGTPPPVLMLKHAAVALLTGVDSLFPEVGTQIAKSGADLAVIVSAIGAIGSDLMKSTGIDADLPHGWSIDDLARQWQITANGCVHLVAADASGYGFSANQAAYCSMGQSTLTSWSPATVLFDTASQRNKLLNWYYDFDLDALLERTPAAPR